MKIKSFTKLALVATTAISMGYMASAAYAAQTATVPVHITTDSSINAATVAVMDFGSWAIGVRAGATPTITMNASTGVMATAALGGSTVQKVTGTLTGQRGQATVDLPDGVTNAVLQMTMTGFTDFTDAGLSLTQVQYVTATETTPTTLPLDGLTSVPVTVRDGDTAEDVFFGGTITADAPPADATHNATFEITFAY